MKYFKLGVVAFIISLVFSQVGVNATSALTLLEVKLPKSGNNYYYQTEPYTKEVDNYQYYRSSVTKTNGFPFHEISVIARTVSSSNVVSEGLVLGTKEMNKWRQGYNYYSGDYSLRLERGNASIFTASHWGDWYLDERIALAVN